MDAHVLLADLHSRGIRLIPDGEKLWAEPAEQLSDADRIAIRQSKAELMRLLVENDALPSLLLTVADAIADAPCAPILNELALSKSRDELRRRPTSEPSRAARPPRRNSANRGRQHDSRSPRNSTIQLPSRV